VSLAESADAVSATAWELLREPHPFDARTLSETLDGGQAFRWFYGIPQEGAWTGIWAHNVVELRLGTSGNLEYRSPTGTRPESIRQYLAADRVEELSAALPCQSDPVLAGLRARWGGLSLLRQPVGETLLAFICSSNKRIPQIREMLNNMAAAFGEAIPGTTCRAMPTWRRLAAVTEAELRACALGYRARHVAGTAAFLKDQQDFLESVHGLPLAEARSRLCRLPGVGPKVAECVLLFGYGRTDAFPVDIWIDRLMRRHYPELAGWSQGQVATFARLHFGRAAGLAQQWLFASRSDH